MSSSARGQGEQTARARILKAAGHLFHANGYHAVGVDTVVAQSGVAKMTLYRHFPRKDDLVAAYLEDADAQVNAMYAQAAQDKPPLEQLRAVVALTGAIAEKDDCLGCAFQACVSEFPDGDHPGRKVAERHKQHMLDLLVGMAQAAGFEDAVGLGTALQLLLDGAWVAARRRQARVTAAQLSRAAEALFQAWPRARA